MHELPITESILKIVLKHAETNNVRQVMAIHLQVGKLSDLEDEWIQRYFDYLSKGTVAQGAKLKIERTPIMVQCDACSNSYETEVSAPPVGGGAARFFPEGNTTSKRWRCSSGEYQTHRGQGGNPGR